MSKKLYADQDINDLVENELDIDGENFYKGRGPDRGPRKRRGDSGETENKLKEIHAFHGDKMDESMKRYLDPKNTDSYSHKVRVNTEHQTMKRRGKS